MNDILEPLGHPLVLPIVIALAAGGAAYVLSRWLPVVCRALSLAGSVAVLIAGIRAARAGDAVFAWTWVERLMPGIDLTVDLAASALGLLVAIGSAAFALLVGVYSVRAMAGEYWEGKFHAYLLWTLGGACIVGLAGNLLVLLVGWELVSLMLFLMLNQGRRDANAGAAKAYGMLGFADACLLMAIVMLVAAGGSAAWSLSAPARTLGEGALGTDGYVVYVLILIAALAKAGAIPLHTWIPSAAADAPTPVMAYLPAALDKLLGIYLLSVLTLRMFRPNWTMQVVLMVIGGVTILAAVLMAMIQHNLKRLLGFHAVSQVGYMVLGIGTGTTIGVIGGLFHMLNNAIYKCDLFLMSGTVGRAAGTDEIARMGGLARRLPITFASGLIAAAAISGIPPFNGFVSKWLIYQGTLNVHAAAPGLAVSLVVVAVFGSALTLASFVKVMYAAFLAPAPPDAAAPAARESAWRAAPMVVLALACIGLGLAPDMAITSVFEPAIRIAETTGAGIATREDLLSTGIGWWAPSQATVLILLGMFGGLALLWVMSAGRRIRVVRPFLGGEVPVAGDDRFRVPATHFYETIQKLPVLGGLLGHGQQGAMDLYHWSGKYGKGVVEVLRAQHTGLLGLYVAWAVLGLVITLICLLLSTG